MSSLVAIVRLNALPDPIKGEITFNPFHGGIDDLGFGSGSVRALSHRPPRPEKVPYDFQCRDRFFFLGTDDGGNSLGCVQVSEALVYDYQMRSEIDFTGLRLTIALHMTAYEAYLDYIGNGQLPYTSGDQTTWDGRIVLRIPSQPFAFPMPRGSSDPWHVGKRVVDPLKVIKRFALDEIEIQALRDGQGRRVRFDDAAPDECSGWQPALSLRA